MENGTFGTVGDGERAVDWMRHGKGEERMMSIGQSISTVFTKYAEFRGLATRAEFWWWILFTALVSMALSSIPVPMWTVTDQGQLALTMTTTLAGLWGLAVLLPTLAVTVRRLRDAGYEWGHIFWALLPIAGAIVLIVLCAQPTRVAVHPSAPPAMQPLAQPAPPYAPPRNLMQTTR